MGLLHRSNRRAAANIDADIAEIEADRLTGPGLTRQAPVRSSLPDLDGLYRPPRHEHLAAAVQRKGRHLASGKQALDFPCQRGYLLVPRRGGVDQAGDVDAVLDGAVDDEYDDCGCH